MNLAIIGGGPAGLRAAEVAAAGGASVTVFDAKPSVGRKFLVAGRGGLNLTNSEPHERFVSRFTSPEQAGHPWDSLIAGFDPEALRAWATTLGIETFTASTGRVYPKDLKAAPLLRHWVQRLRELGVTFLMNHLLKEVRPGKPLELSFETSGGVRLVRSDCVILALGGGSWPQTGSNGEWTSFLGKIGVAVSPLQPANCGWEMQWASSVLARAEGMPLKNIMVYAGETEAQGELLITRYGLEGGALYKLGRTLRSMDKPSITIDFKPAFTVEQLVCKMSGVRDNHLAHARDRWRLSDGAFAIAETFGPFASAESLAIIIKKCNLPLRRQRPLAEAISSSGGVCWNELDDGLMLKMAPGVFVAGEMINWEAPTGGYLIHGCLATGTRAGVASIEWFKGSKQSDPQLSPPLKSREASDRTT